MWANLANIYGESVTEHGEAEQDWRRKSSSLIGQQQTNLSNLSSGVQIPPDICTRLALFVLYEVQLDNKSPYN